MDKMKLERMLDADFIAVSLDDIYGSDEKTSVESGTELRQKLLDAVDELTAIINSNSKIVAKVATKDAEIEELKTLMAEMAETIRELKAKVDAPKAGNDTPIGLN